MGALGSLQDEIQAYLEAFVARRKYVAAFTSRFAGALLEYDKISFERISFLFEVGASTGVTLFVLCFVLHVLHVVCQYLFSSVVLLPMAMFFSVSFLAGSGPT